MGIFSVIGGGGPKGENAPKRPFKTDYKGLLRVPEKKTKVLNTKEDLKKPNINKTVREKMNLL